MPMPLTSHSVPSCELPSAAAKLPLFECESSPQTLPCCVVFSCGAAMPKPGCAKSKPGVVVGCRWFACGGGPAGTGGTNPLAIADAAPSPCPFTAPVPNANSGFGYRGLGDAPALFPKLIPFAPFVVAPSRLIVQRHGRPGTELKRWTRHVRRRNLTSRRQRRRGRRPVRRRRLRREPRRRHRRPLAVSAGSFSAVGGIGVGGNGAVNTGSTCAPLPTNAAANDPSTAVATPALAADA